MSLYIGNLSPHIHQDELEHVFREFGSCRVQKKDGYGFAVYDFPPNADKALRALRGRKICGKSLSLSWSNKQPNKPFQKFTTGNNHRAYDSHHGRTRNFTTGENVSRSIGMFNRTANKVKFQERKTLFDVVSEEKLYNWKRRKSSTNRGQIDDVKQDLPLEGETVNDHEPNLTDDGRWGEEFHGSGENGIEFERYEPSQGYFDRNYQKPLDGSSFKENGSSKKRRRKDMADMGRDLKRGRGLVSDHRNSRSPPRSPLQKSKSEHSVSVSVSSSLSKSRSGSNAHVSRSGGAKLRSISPTPSSLPNPDLLIQKDSAEEETSMKSNSKLVENEELIEGSVALGNKIPEITTNLAKDSFLPLLEKTGITGEGSEYEGLEGSQRIGSSPSISANEMDMLRKHYGMDVPEGDESHLAADSFFGSARLWPWEIIFYRRMKKGLISVENYARRVAQNEEFGIVDKYIRSSSGWGELSQGNALNR